MTTLSRAAGATGPQHEGAPATSEVAAVSWLLVLTISAFAATAYAYLGIERNRSYRTGGYDLGLFHEAVLHLSNGQAPASAVKAFAEGTGTSVNLWGDHSHYVIALWAPLYRLYPHPVTLIVAQAVLVAAALPAVWLVARRRLGGPLAPWVAMGCAIAAWGTTSAIGFDVHEVAFALPLLAWGVERGLAGRWRAATVLVLLLLLVKEDEGPVVVTLGIWMAVLGQRKRGLAVGLAGVAGLLLTTQVAIPAVSGESYAYFTYTSLGKTPLDALVSVFTHPVRLVQTFVNDPEKRQTLKVLLLPAGLIGLLSPLLVVLVPLLAARMLSDNQSLWGLSYHYNALPCLVLVLAAVDSLARWRKVLPGPRAVLPRLVPVLALAVLLRQTSQVSWSLADGYRSVGQGLFALAPDVRANFDAAVAAVPHGQAVTASNLFVPHLLDRCGERTSCDVRLLQISVGAATGPNAKRALPDPLAPPQTPFVMIDLLSGDYPDDDLQLSAAYAGLLTSEGWSTVFSATQVVVLRAPARA